MSYLSISQAATDPLLRARIAACCAQESTDTATHPLPLADAIQWRCCGEPGWGEAWESAKAAGNENIGADPAVITDAMILTAVQKHLTK